MKLGTVIKLMFTIIWTSFKYPTVKSTIIISEDRIKVEHKKKEKSVRLDKEDGGE